jgi:hypothetical protein
MVMIIPEGMEMPMTFDVSLEEITPSKEPSKFNTALPVL